MNDLLPIDLGQISVAPRVSPAQRTARRRLIAMQRQSLFPMAMLIVEAATNSARASILLRMPDAAFTGHAGDLRKACLAVEFGDGAQFVTIRELATLTVRDEHGELPLSTAAELVRWRRGMAAIAGAPL